LYKKKLFGRKGWGKKWLLTVFGLFFFVAIYQSCRSGQYCRGKKRKIIKQTNMESRYSYNFKYIGVEGEKKKVLWHLNHKKFMIKHYPESLSEKKGEDIFSNCKYAFCEEYFFTGRKKGSDRERKKNVDMV